MAEPDALTFRHPCPADQPAVLAVLEHWWGGVGGAEAAAQRALLLPRLFFQHFTSTSPTPASWRSARAGRLS